MARSAETDADRELIAHAAQFGFQLTARTLEDWRRAGAMPARIRIDLGRRGTRYEDPPDAKQRLIGICCFMRKRPPFRERPDLPRRRRIQDALPWLYYEGIVAGGAIRDRVIDYWEGLADEVDAAREQARAQLPDATAAELAVAAADEIADQLARHRGARRPLAVFASHREQLGDDPQLALRDAFSELFLAVQGEGTLDHGKLGHLLEHVFIQSGLEDAPIDDELARGSLLRGLEPQRACRAVWNLTEDDWRFVRTFIHLFQGVLISLERHNEDRRLREMGRIAPKLNTTGRLLFATGYIAAVKDEVQEGIERRANEGPPAESPAFALLDGPARAYN